MGVVAADGAGIRAHRDRPQPHALIGPQVAHHVPVVGPHRRVAVHVEVVAVLHQELAAAHDAEAGADLVPELPLDVVERQRQVAVACDVGAEDVGDHLLVGGPVEEVAVRAVPDPQHLGAVGVVAARLLPQVRGLDRRHQHRDVARAGLLLVDDPLHAPQDAAAQRQPRIDPGRGLLDHPRAQHQAMRGDLRLRGRLLQDGQEVAAQAHGGSGPRADGPYAIAPHRASAGVAARGTRSLRGISA